MSDPTKACNLTEEEIKSLLIRTGEKFGWPNADFESLMERMNYLNKRLKAFFEVEKVEDKPTATPPIEQKAWS